MYRRSGWRLGVGDVFLFEWRTASSRWHRYAYGAALLILLVMALLVMWISIGNPGISVPIRTLAQIDKWFYIGVVSVELTLILLVAPAATAGAICLDRARGTLAHVLVTDLSSAEIVLGKLAARLVPALGLVACTAPLMEILTLLGGVDPDALLGALIVMTGVALLSCSFALLLSLWSGKTHEALLGTYAAWAVWLLRLPITAVNLVFPGTLTELSYLRSDPFALAFAPYTTGLLEWEDYAWFLGVSVLLSGLCIAVAVLRFRAIATRDAVKRERSRSVLDRLGKRLALGRYLPGPSLDWNPVFWRERRYSRPSRWALAGYLAYFALSAFFSLTIFAFPPPQRAGLAAFTNGIEVCAGLLLMSVTAASSLAEERSRGGLDVLLTTRLTTRQILLGKWLGTFRFVPVLTVCPMIAVCAVVYDRPERWLGVFYLIAYMCCAGAAIASVGLAMATWFNSIGKAVATTVWLYVAVAIGWPFMVFLLQARGGYSEGMMMASPFVWAFVVTGQVVVGGPRGGPQDESWAIIWCLALALVALALGSTVLTSFERNVGRAEGPWVRLLPGHFARRERTAWALFVGAAIPISTLMMLTGWGGGAAFLLTGTLAAVGLLMAAVAAAISCAREFERAETAPVFGAGTDGVTRQWACTLVLAKWLGRLRLVFVVAVLVTLAQLGQSRSALIPFGTLCLLPTYITVAGGAWCALGVLVGARWARRSAYLLTAGLYTLVLGLAPAWGEPIFAGGSVSALWVLSPFVAASKLTTSVNGGLPISFDEVGGILTAIGLYAAAAPVLLATATLAVERRLGRQRIPPAQTAPASAA